MLNKDLEVSLNTAFRNASSKFHEFMTVEHLLLSLVSNQSTIDALQAFGVDLDELESKLDEFIEETTPIIPENDRDRKTQPTLGFQRVLQRAVFHVQSSGKEEVKGVNVLVAVFSEEESQATYILKSFGLTRLDIVNYITHGVSNLDDEDAIEEAFDEEYDESFDYKNLLKLKEEELDAVRSELEKIKKERELAIEIHEADKKEFERKVNNSEKIIKELAEKIDRYNISNDAETITRTINFKPEHMQAGLSILTYFSEIIRQKYPDMHISISIKQQDDVVSLIIVTEDGNKEVIKKTLDEYGKVVAGKLLPQDFLRNPIHIAQLENKLELANTEIRSLERLLGIQADSIQYLKDNIERVSEFHRINQKTLDCAINKLPDNINIDAIFGFLKSLKDRDSLTEEEIIKVKNSVNYISQNNPENVNELKQYWVNVSSGMVATIVLNSLKMLGV
jgi:hypothetical protein